MVLERERAGKVVAARLVLCYERLTHAERPALVSCSHGGQHRGVEAAAEAVVRVDAELVQGQVDRLSRCGARRRE